MVMGILNQADCASFNLDVDKTDIWDVACPETIDTKTNSQLRGALP